MSEEERLQLENELLMTCSKAQAIDKYIDELEESSKLSELWCISQQENKLLKERIGYLERSIARKEDTIEDYIHETVKLDEYKEVINEVREYVNNHIHQETFTGYMDSYELKKLLQILDKAGD